MKARVEKAGVVGYESACPPASSGAKISSIDVATMVPRLSKILAAIRSRLATMLSSRTPKIVPIAPADLVSQFESLGDNCEFGLVQRFCGVEPLGLFRFSLSRLDSLIEAFRSDLDQIGTETDLDLVSLYDDDEIQGRSRHYDDFVYHTEVMATGCDMSALRVRELKKIGYLKQRFLDDLRSGDKIFIRKEGAYRDAVELSKIMRRHGPTVLMWVEGETERAKPGAVHRVRRGLVKGHVLRLASHRDVPSLDLEGWLRLCLEAMRVVRRVRYRLIENQILQEGEVWKFEDLCIARATDDRRFLDRSVNEIRLKDDTERSNAIVASRYIEARITERSLATFSVWMWIPSAFQGSVIDVYFPFSATGYLGVANLEKRDQWQRVWASTRLPKGQINAMAAIRLTGRKDDTILVGTWRFEDGCVPNEWTLPDPFAASPTESSPKPSGHRHEPS